MMRRSENSPKWDDNTQSHTHASRFTLKILWIPWETYQENQWLAHSGTPATSTQFRIPDERRAPPTHVIELSKRRSSMFHRKVFQ